MKAKNIHKIEGINKVYCMDWTKNSLPDKSVQLIIADPPYFEVKGEFDFVWSSFEDYLKDVEKWAIECKRLLADNGTLIWWGDSKKIAYSQIIFDKYFNLLNSCVWEKAENDGLFGSIGNQQLRTFPKSTERFLLYSSKAMDSTGLEAVEKEYIAPKNPFALYLKSEFKKAGVSKQEIASLFLSKTGGLTGIVRNWILGRSNPTKEQYLKIRNYLNGEYLRKEYEDLRRPFNNFSKSTEVLKFRFELSSADHETTKAESVTKVLIETCSRVGDLVLVPFAGSGTECAIAARTKRNFIAFDIEQKYVDMSNKRCKYIFQTPTLF